MWGWKSSPRASLHFGITCGLCCGGLVSFHQALQLQNNLLGSVNLINESILAKVLALFLPLPLPFVNPSSHARVGCPPAGGPLRRGEVCRGAGTEGLG